MKVLSIFTIKFRGKKTGSKSRLKVLKKIFIAYDCDGAMNQLHSQYAKANVYNIYLDAVYNKIACYRLDRYLFSQNFSLN